MSSGNDNDQPPTYDFDGSEYTRAPDFEAIANGIARINVRSHEELPPANLLGTFPQPTFINLLESVNDPAKGYAALRSPLLWNTLTNCGLESDLLSDVLILYQEHIRGNYIHALDLNMNLLPPLIDPAESQGELASIMQLITDLGCRWINKGSC